jgi:hypothetical protein
MVTCRCSIMVGDYIVAFAPGKLARFCYNLA